MVALVLGLASRDNARPLEVPSDSLVPMMLAAAAQGVVQAAQVHWWVHGGDLAATVSEGLEVLERGIDSDPHTWSDDKGNARSRLRR